MEFKVVEIFDSIEGEGKRAGIPATFIRLAGCNLHCSYCDTEYALLDGSEPCKYNVLTADEITAKMNSKFKRVTLTGGEPLTSKDCDELVSMLLAEKFEVNIETNGSVDINKFKSKIKNTDDTLLFFTVDYKLISSGSNEKMLMQNFTSLNPGDVIKFVVGSNDDNLQMIDFVKKLTPLYKTMPHIYIGAVYGKYDLQRIAETILNTDELKNAKLQLQLHKIIWGENAVGV